jgi:hypothetical protein
MTTMSEVPAITTPDFSEFVRFANSLPRVKRTELHCHPGVVIALRQAAPPEEYPPWKPPMGTIDLIVSADMEPGAWEIREDGEVIKSGKLTPQADHHG